MANIFNSIFQKKVGSSNFDMSYDHKLTANMGELVPFHVQECVPGDRFRLGASAMVRFAPILAPIMHKVDVYLHYFFVPNRILWDNWEKFITGGDSGTAAPAHPFFSVKEGSFPGTLSDYLGIPSWPASVPGKLRDYDLNALPYAAYQAIFNDYYRDENLQEAVNFKLADGDNESEASMMVLRRRAWQHDYFTGALPFAQKGNPVSIPLGNITLDPDWGANGEIPTFRSPDGSTTPDGDIQRKGGDAYYKDPNSASEGNVAYDPNGSLVNEATTITDLRNAFKLQEWLEKNARGGTRYIENLLAHFDVRSSDRRLDRPEFLGGARQPLVVSEVLQTSSTDTTSPQANMAGHGISVGGGSVKPYFCEEHGWIFGIMSVMPSTAYFQGIPRAFSRKDRLDYYWPAFQHIGEQSILNKELYADTDDPNGIFGYVPRYAEYKYLPSRVSGDFKESLLYWHLARKFDAPPALNGTFIECNPSNRIYAVIDENVDHLYCHVFNDVKVRRKMAKYSNPGF